MESQKHPVTLYKRCLFAVAENLVIFGRDLKSFPVQQVCDVYEQVCKGNKIEDLSIQLSDIQHFLRILKSNASNWNTLFECVQMVLVEKQDFGKLLSTSSITEVTNDVKECLLSKIKDCILMSIFFAECGLFESASICLSCVKILQESEDTEMLEMATELWTRLALVYTADCKFPEANYALNAAEKIIQQITCQENNNVISKSMFYTARSSHLYALSRYIEAHESAIQAVAELSPKLPYKVVVDSLRQAAKTSIIKRMFKQAGLLVKYAVQLTRQVFGECHPKYAECLTDYGFYLLNVDAVAASVDAYQAALEIRRKVFGLNNILTAGSHEDLAYALYVRDYSSGNFHKAREHAEVAIRTFTKVLEPEHLLLASSKRVKALILEEVAIDSFDMLKRDKLLAEAEELHLESLKLARNSFGESNVQTAKHYGNLGRLYQSMKRYKEAEQMHLRAIQIKESLLGKEDYEVALSLGHLASLYNYDMAEYEKAEQLYIKSIRIGCHLFGECYSGLEYDYRGLINLYANTGNYVEMARYHLVLADWQELRKNVNKPPIIEQVDQDQPVCLNDFIKTFQIHS
ncbi:amyloid protein-binding protein 2-like [Rhopilema esculentum]|uniref:amyloid protein-binding protein 2-like n=1 Tax=Rhopilema esculentum TaxID=499914 RepID=UPI0031DFE7E6